MLFDLKFFRSLRLLSIITKRHFRGEKIGHRRSPNRGSSAEFAEYKEYMPGDDLRFIDWNLYARLEKLYIKKFHNEEDLAVSILVDASASMTAGTPSKFDYARKIAGSISWIGLQHHDAVRIHTFAGSLAEPFEAGFRRSHIHRLLGFLEQRQSGGGNGSFEDVVTRFLSRTRRPGVVFVITDAWLGEDLYTGLKRLAHRKFETTLVQVLTPEEVNPDIAGLVDLIDSEDQNKVSLTVNGQALALYEEILKETFDELQQFLSTHQMRYQRCLTSTPFESAILRLFEATGAS